MLETVSQPEAPRKRHLAPGFDGGFLGQYEALFSVKRATSHAVIGEWSPSIFRRGPPAWSTRDSPVPPTLAWRALAGGRLRVDLRGVSRARHIVLDFDLHGVERRGGRASYRRALANKCQPAVDVLLELFPDIAFIVERTPRGFHAIVILDREESTTLLAELAKQMGEVVAARLPRGSGVGIESFPVIDGSAGRYCALPLMQSRLVRAGSLAEDLHRTRAEDLEAVARSEPSSLEDLLEFAASCPPPSPTQIPPATIPSPITPTHLRGPEKTQQRRKIRVVRWGKLKGPHYVAEVSRIVKDGIDAGESWDCARRLGFALRIGFGFTPELSAKIFAAFIEQAKHRSASCQTKDGRKRLLGKFQSQLRHNERRLAENPNWRPGRMHAPETKRELLALIGIRIEIAPPVPKQKIVERSYESASEFLNNRRRKISESRRTASRSQLREGGKFVARKRTAWRKNHEQEESQRGPQVRRGARRGLRAGDVQGRRLRARMAQAHRGNEGDRGEGVLLTSEARSFLGEKAGSVDED